MITIERRIVEQDQIDEESFEGQSQLNYSQQEMEQAALAKLPQQARPGLTVAVTEKYRTAMKAVKIIVIASIQIM